MVRLIKVEAIHYMCVFVSEKEGFCVHACVCVCVCVCTTTVPGEDVKASIP